MNNKFKNLIAVAAVSYTVCQSGAAFAHDQAGSLGATVGATDYYQVTCSKDGVDTKQLNIQVKDLTAGASILSVQVHKGLVARNTTDVTGADGVYSPLVSVAGGNGTYNVMVDKTTAAARNYTFQFHCMNGTTHTGTSISRKQDN
jgi:hypothetical protein